MALNYTMNRKKTSCECDGVLGKISDFFLRLGVGKYSFDFII